MVAEGSATTKVLRKPPYLLLTSEGCGGELMGVVAGSMVFVVRLSTCYGEMSTEGSLRRITHRDWHLWIF